MTLSATNSIRRGLVNLGANWELVGFQLLQVLLVSVLVLAGFAPPLAVLGWPEWGAWGQSAQDWPALVDSAAAMVARGQEAWALLLAATLLTAAIWLMAMLVYCYFQGGIFGVLVAGDRQAPAGRPRDWKWFRTFSARNFRGWAGRYLWRYFWLLNLFALITTAWLLVPTALMALTVWGETRWGLPAAIGIGCGGAIPAIFSMLVLAFWSQISQADLAREDSGVRSATRRGLQVMGRRLGTVIILGLLLFLTIVTLTVSVAFLSTLLELFPSLGPAMRWVGQTALTLIEWVSTSIISLSFAAILVALNRGESTGNVPA